MLPISAAKFGNVMAAKMDSPHIVVSINRNTTHFSGVGLCIGVPNHPPIGGKFSDSAAAVPNNNILLSVRRDSKRTEFRFKKTAPSKALRHQPCRQINIRLIFRTERAIEPFLGCTRMMSTINNI